jgi:hypothetical protein
MARGESVGQVLRETKLKMIRSGVPTRRRSEEWSRK